MAYATGLLCLTTEKICFVFPFRSSNFLIDPVTTMACFANRLLCYLCLLGLPDSVSSCCHSGFQTRFSVVCINHCNVNVSHSRISLHIIGNGITMTENWISIEVLQYHTTISSFDGSLHSRLCCHRDFHDLT